MTNHESYLLVRMMEMAYLFISEEVWVDNLADRRRTRRQARTAVRRAMGAVRDEEHERAARALEDGLDMNELIPIEKQRVESTTQFRRTYRLLVIREGCFGEMWITEDITPDNVDVRYFGGFGDAKRVFDKMVKEDQDCETPVS